jgi:cob(I)alamin adenosyltransferase
VKIYTKTGDSGETSLYSGERVRKSDPRVEVCGALDELNSVLGVALAAGISSRGRSALRSLQVKLFVVGADVATTDGTHEIPRISSEDVLAIEREIDAIVDGLPAQNSFILPGGCPGSAHLHLARTVCRRAEREAAAAGNLVGQNVKIYLNRLSDYLFVLARRENQFAGCAEVLLPSRDAR